MCDPVTIGATLAVGGGALGAVGAYQQGNADLAVAKYNARQQENQAIRVRNKGVDDENIMRTKTAEKVARQRTQFAAGSVDVNVGSALTVQEDTLDVGNADALRIRSNAQDQAQALDDQSRLTLMTGRQALRSSRLRAGASLLNSAGSAATGAS